MGKVIWDLVSRRLPKMKPFPNPFEEAQDRYGGREIEYYFGDQGDTSWGKAKLKLIPGENGWDIDVTGVFSGKPPAGWDLLKTRINGLDLRKLVLGLHTRLSPMAIENLRNLLLDMEHYNWDRILPIIVSQNIFLSFADRFNCSTDVYGYDAEDEGWQKNWELIYGPLAGISACMWVKWFSRRGQCRNNPNPRRYPPRYVCPTPLVAEAGDNSADIEYGADIDFEHEQRIEHLDLFWKAKNRFYDIAAGKLGKSEILEIENSVKRVQEKDEDIGFTIVTDHDHEERRMYGMYANYLLDKGITFNLPENNDGDSDAPTEDRDHPVPNHTEADWDPDQMPPRMMAPRDGMYHIAEGNWQNKVLLDLKNVYCRHVEAMMGKLGWNDRYMHRQFCMPGKAWYGKYRSLGDYSSLDKAYEDQYLPYGYWRPVRDSEYRELLLLDLFEYQYGCQRLQNDLCQSFNAVISLSLKTEDMDPSDPRLSAYQLCFLIEDRLAEYCIDALTKVLGEQWWERGVHPDIRKRAKETKYKHPSDRSLEYYLYLSDWGGIIESSWTIFRKSFTKAAKTDDKRKSLQWVTPVMKIRNKVMHPRGQKIMPDEVDILRDCLRIIQTASAILWES